MVMLCDASVTCPGSRIKYTMLFHSRLEAIESVVDDFENINDLCAKFLGLLIEFLIDMASEVVDAIMDCVKTDGHLFSKIVDLLVETLNPGANPLVEVFKSEGNILKGHFLFDNLLFHAAIIISCLEKRKRPANGRLSFLYS